MESDNAELLRKLDQLTSQVQYLSEQAQIAERQRQERSELMHDLTPIATQAFNRAVSELEEVQEYVDLDDLVRLVKRLLRNGRMIEGMLDQLEGVSDLVQTLTPLADEAMGKAVDVLADGERKGYFVFARGGLRIAEKIVTSFDEDDVRQLGDNVVLILRTVKEMTQPEVMSFVLNTVQVLDAEKDKPAEASIRSLLGQMRDPNVRRGLGLTLRVLRGIGAGSAARS